jgi:hypothetical protein
MFAMDFTLDLALQVVLIYAEKGVVSFSAPYYGQFVTSKSMELPVLLVIAFGLTLRLISNRKRNFWVQSCACLSIIVLPWFIHCLRTKSFDLGPRFGPLVGSIPLFICLFESVSNSNVIATIVAFLIRYKDLLHLNLGCCNILAVAAISTTILFSIQSSQRKIFRTKQITLLFLLLTAFASRYGLTLYGVQQCSPIAPHLKQYVLERSESVTGFVSVVRVSSDYGPILVLRCDHSLLGGIFLNHQNSSIFGSFYYMDFIRYVERAPSNQLRVLQMYH